MADPDTSRHAPQIDWEAFYANYRKPDFVPGYEVLQKLGAGAFGLVFKARKQSIGKDYAIKFLKVDDASVRDAVVHELGTVRLFAQIDHPNLVTIEDMGHVAGIPYIVMGYAGEDTLARRLQAGRLEREEALRILVQVARAVQALHERMLVHFDLKPANVYLKGDTARLGDYGLSKLVTASRRSLSFGRGTTYYMAPEVLQRRGDHRSDIYSLGVMLYECLVGHVPFRGETEWEVLKKHETEAPVYPQELAAADRAVIDACLQKDPDRRLQSVAEVLANLQSPAVPATARVAAAAAPAAGADRKASRQQRRPRPARSGRPMRVLLGIFLVVMLVNLLNGRRQRENRASVSSRRPHPSYVHAPAPAPPVPDRVVRLDGPVAAEAETEAAAAAAAAEDEFRVRLDAAIIALRRLRETEVFVPTVRDKAMSALGATLRNLDLKSFRGQDPLTEALMNALKAGLEHDEVRQRWGELVEALTPHASR